MGVKTYTQPSNVAGAVKRHFFCDIEGELPSSGLSDGDEAFTADFQKRWIRVSSVWIELATGGLLGNSYIRLGSDIQTRQTGTSTDEQDLNSVAFATSVLAVTGKGVKVRSWGRTSGNINTKALRAYMNDELLIQNTLTVAPAGPNWIMEADIYKIAAANQYKKSAWMIVGTVDQNPENDPVMEPTPGATITFKMTGQPGVVAIAGDIICDGLLVDLIP